MQREWKAASRWFNKLAPNFIVLVTMSTLAALARMGSDIAAISHSARELGRVRDTSNAHFRKICLEPNNQELIDSPCCAVRDKIRAL